MKRVYNAPSMEETTITTHVSICSGLPSGAPESPGSIEEGQHSFAPKHA